MPNNGKSPHILNTSATLLGFCLVMITSIRVGNYRSASFIDEVSGVAAMFLIGSCILSFLSMKVEKARIASLFEEAADAAFFSALMALCLTIGMLSFNLFS